MAWGPGSRIWVGGRAANTGAPSGLKGTAGNGRALVSPPFSCSSLGSAGPVIPQSDSAWSSTAKSLCASKGLSMNALAPMVLASSKVSS